MNGSDLGTLPSPGTVRIAQLSPEAPPPSLLVTLLMRRREAVRNSRQR